MIPKFRAWVKPGVLSNHPDGVVADAKPDFLGMECLVKRDDLKGKKCFTEIFDFEDVELMQSTGLKDKNGVEIFEGDIVVGQQHLTTDSSTPFEIKGLVRYSKRNTMFYLDEKSFGHDKFMHSLGSSIYQYEVIGNIYENPELLEVEG